VSSQKVEHVRAGAAEADDRELLDRELARHHVDLRARRRRVDVGEGRILLVRLDDRIRARRDRIVDLRGRPREDRDVSLYLLVVVIVVPARRLARERVLRGDALADLERGAAVPDARDLRAGVRAGILAHELDRVVRRSDRVVAVEVEARDQHAAPDLARAVHVRHVPDDQVPCLDVDVVPLVAKPAKVVAKID
jgi:hypothetical protein